MSFLLIIITFLLGLFTLYIHPIPLGMAAAASGFFGDSVYKDSSRNILLDFYFLIFPAKDAQEIIGFMLSIFCSFYRATYVIARTNWNKYTKIVALIISSVFVRLGTAWVMTFITQADYGINITFIQVFSAYNIMINLLAIYVIGFISSNIMIFLCQRQKNHNSLFFGNISRNSFENVIDGIIVGMKIIRLVSLFGIIQNLFFLYNHTLPIAILGTGTEHSVLLYLWLITFSFLPFFINLDVNITA